MDGSPKILDRNIALERVGGDAELLREIAELFLQNYRQWFSEIAQAAERGDAVAVEHAAHGLKGSVANFGAQAAVDAAFAVEQIGRSRNLAEVGNAIHKLELALAALHPELESL